MLIGNIINLPLIGRNTPPTLPKTTDEPASPSAPSTPPSQAGGQPTGSHNGENQAGSSPDTTPSHGSQAPSRSNGHAMVRDRYNPISAEMQSDMPADDLKIEAWARRAALEVQKNEQFASMLMSLAKPEASEQVALLQNDLDGGADFSSVAAAYRENQDDLSGGTDTSQQ